RNDPTRPRIAGGRRDWPCLVRFPYRWLTGGGRETRLCARCQIPQASRHGRNPDRFKPPFEEPIAFPSHPKKTTGRRWRNLYLFPRGHVGRFVEVRVVSMRVAVSVLRANGRPCVIAALAAIRCILRSSGSAAVIAVAVTALLAEPVRADTLPEALV